jgi:hypothetical protein
MYGINNKEYCLQKQYSLLETQHAMKRMGGHKSTDTRSLSLSIQIFFVQKIF